MNSGHFELSPLNLTSSIAGRFLLSNSCLRAELDVTVPDPPGRVVSSPSMRSSINLSIGWVILTLLLSGFSNSSDLRFFVKVSSLDSLYFLNDFNPPDEEDLEEFSGGCGEEKLEPELELFDVRLGA